jgi:hypothetical protein
VLAAVIVYAGLALAGLDGIWGTARQINLFVGDLPRSISELRTYLTGIDHAARQDEGLWFHVTHAARELQGTLSGGTGQERNASRVVPVGHPFDVR